MKELWQLIKMLFSSKPGDFDTPELLPMKHYPFKRYRFMMWCGRMIYRAENKENIDRYMQTYAGKESMTHETIHLRQAQVIGSWVKYYWRYFVEWVKGNPICHPASSAYYTISYEMEAYANESNLDYPVNYDGSNLSRYKIKGGRKKLYKSIGGTSKAWKTYIRTL